MRKLLVLILILVVIKALLLMLAGCTDAGAQPQPAEFGASFRMDEAAAAGGN